MNNAKEIVEATGKAFVKELVRFLPLGNTALDVYEEIQSKQVERKIKRLEEFYSKLTVTLQTQQDKINKEFVNKEDFLDVFEEVTRYVVLERQEQKRQLYKNILVNSITSATCDYDKTERYFRLLDNLTETEIKILAVLDNPKHYNDANGMPVKDPINNAYQTSWNLVTGSGVLTQVLGMKIHEVEDAITVLFSNGLIFSNVLDRKLETNANGIHVLDNLLTTRGKDFVKFLKE